MKRIWFSCSQKMIHFICYHWFLKAPRPCCLTEKRIAIMLLHISKMYELLIQQRICKVQESRETILTEKDWFLKLFQWRQNYIYTYKSQHHPLQQTAQNLWVIMLFLNWFFWKKIHVYNVQAGWFGNNVVVRNMWPDCYHRDVVGWITGIGGYELFRREAVKKGKECCLMSGNGLIMKRHLWETATDRLRVGKG